MPGPFPCADGRRIIHADGPIRLDDLPSTFGGLPFKSIAEHTLGSGALPHIAPEILHSFRALASLNARGHALEFHPGLGRMIISVLAQQIRPVFQASER